MPSTSMTAAGRRTAALSPILRFVAIALLLGVMSVVPSSSRADDSVYFWGDFLVNGVYEVGRIVYPAGSKTVLPIQGLTGSTDIDVVAVSPDGLTIAVGGKDFIGEAIINLYPADGTGSPAMIHIGPSTESFAAMRFSPDGNWVSFISDHELDLSNALYVVPSSPGTPAKRLSQTPVSTATDVQNHAWAGDSQHIVFVGDPTVASVEGIWSVDALAVTPSPVEIVPFGSLTTDLDVRGEPEFDSAGRVYFLTDYQTTSGSDQLYRADIDGQNLGQVPGTVLANGGGEATVGAFGISPHGTRIAFSADAPDADLFQVYTAQIGGAATLVSNVQTTPSALEVRSPSLFNPIQWSPDGTQLGVQADWDPGDGTPDNDNSAYVLPASAPAGGVRIVAVPQAANQDVSAVGFTNGPHLAMRGDLVANNDTELFVATDLTTSDQTAATIRQQAVPLGGDVLGMVIYAEPDTTPPPPADPGLVIQSITDVGNDQGRQVSVVWSASDLDDALSLTPITQYAVYRKIDPDLAALSTRAPIEAPHASLVAPAGWHFLTTVPAFADTSYAVVVPTLKDSTITEGVYYTTFFVRAATATPALYEDSPPDSGYSVDNLEPFAPQNLLASYNTGSGNQLAWDPSPDEDFQYFRIYRDTDPGFTPSPASLVGATAGTGWTDPDNDGGAVVYKVTTVDFSGNESDPASPRTATSVPTAIVPTTYALHQNVPNPFNPATTIRYDVARGGGKVALRIFDVSGRLVRTLVDGAESEGQKNVSWNGRNNQGARTASGTYFYRLTAPGFTQTRKMVLLK